MRQTELDSLKAEYVSEVRDAWARVAVGSEHVRQQEHRVSEKKMRGQQASLSEALLETFRETQQLHKLSCERFLDQLHALESTER
jgi:hypothetical protein